jgi:hypothetical protein
MSLRGSFEQLLTPTSALIMSSTSIIFLCIYFVFNKFKQSECLFFVPGKNLTVYWQYHKRVTNKILGACTRLWK